MTRAIASMRRFHFDSATQQLLPAGSRQPVILRALLVLGQPPLGLDPALSFEAVQRGVERAVVDLQLFLRQVGDGDADAMSVLRPPLERAQHQHVQRALQQLDSVLISLACGHGRRQTTS